MARSVTSTASAQPSGQSARYGTNSRTGLKPLWLVAAVSAVIGLGALVWLAWGASQPQANGEVTNFQVVDDRQVEVMVEVTRPVGREGVCTLEALGDGFAQVGLLDVTLEPSDGAVVQIPVTMATSELATVAVVRSCRLT
ncbi:MAG: DUF4307 domain-containing protein [Beutenbergiaceae bacterium]